MAGRPEDRLFLKDESLIDYRDWQMSDPLDSLSLSSLHEGGPAREAKRQENQRRSVGQLQREELLRPRSVLVRQPQHCAQILQQVGAEPESRPCPYPVGQNLSNVLMHRGFEARRHRFRTLCLPSSEGDRGELALHLQSTLLGPGAQLQVHRSLPPGSTARSSRRRSGPRGPHVRSARSWTLYLEGKNDRATHSGAVIPNMPPAGRRENLGIAQESSPPDVGPRADHRVRRRCRSTQLPRKVRPDGSVAVVRYWTDAAKS